MKRKAAILTSACFLLGLPQPLKAAGLAYEVVMDEISGAPTVPAHRSAQQIRARRVNGDSVIQNTFFDMHNEDRAVSVQRALRIGNLSIKSFDLSDGKSTWKLSDAELAFHGSAQYTPESNCLHTANGWPTDPKMTPTIAGHEQVAGVDTIKMIQDAMTMWRAPSLGCEMVQYSLTMADGTFSTHKATRIVVGDPDPSLFAIPNTTEMPPSQAVMSDVKHRQALQGLPVPVIDAPFEQSLQTQDQWYFAHQP
jgi:hypothetical protein